MSTRARHQPWFGARGNPTGMSEAARLWWYLTPHDIEHPLSNADPVEICMAWYPNPRWLTPRDGFPMVRP